MTDILLLHFAAGCIVFGCVTVRLWPTYRTCANLLFAIGAVTVLERAFRYLALFFPTAARICLIVLWLLVALTVLLAGITAFFVLRTAMSTPPKDLPYILVLGCVVRGTVPTRSLRDRICRAETYLKENPATLCVLSGGLGSRASITEAECMYRELTARGIAPQRLILEEQAKNTWENLLFTCRLLQQREGKTIPSLGVVSSEYHLYRTALMAKKQGLRLIPVPARTDKFILRLNYTLREIGAVWRMIAENY